MSECPVCDKAILGDLGVVRRHLVAFHGGKRHNTAERLTAEEHECQVCLKVFFVRDRRDEHLKNEHHRWDNAKRRALRQVSTKVEFLPFIIFIDHIIWTLHNRTAEHYYHFIGYSRNVSHFVMDRVIHFMRACLYECQDGRAV